MPGSLSLCTCVRAAKEADWMDNRVRTISKGYVQTTDVIPANPPHISRRKELRSWPGEASKNYFILLAEFMLILVGNCCGGARSAQE